MRFYSSYKLTALPPTPADVLEAHYAVAGQAGLRYVYIADYPGHEQEDTRCPSCGGIVI